MKPLEKKSATLKYMTGNKNPSKKDKYKQQMIYSLLFSVIAAAFIAPFAYYGFASLFIENKQLGDGLKIYIVEKSILMIPVFIAVISIFMFYLYKYFKTKNRT